MTGYSRVRASDRRPFRCWWSRVVRGTLLARMDRPVDGVSSVPRTPRLIIAYIAITLSLAYICSPWLLLLSLWISPILAIVHVVLWSIRDDDRHREFVHVVTELMTITVDRARHVHLANRRVQFFSSGSPGPATILEYFSDTPNWPVPSLGASFTINTTSISDTLHSLDWPISRDTKNKNKKIKNKK